MYPDTNGKIPVPTGYSISGSASWFAKADIGITVQRDEGTMVDIHVWKCRFKWVGQTGMVELDYDVPTGIYSEQSFDEDLLSKNEYYDNDNYEF